MRDQRADLRCNGCAENETFAFRIVQSKTRDCWSFWTYPWVMALACPLFPPQRRDYQPSTIMIFHIGNSGNLVTAEGKFDFFRSWHADVLGSTFRQTNSVFLETSRYLDGARQADFRRGFRILSGKWLNCQFEGVTYDQIECVAIGNSLSTIIVEIVLNRFFGLTREKFGSNIKFMTKYVDDSLFGIKDNILDELLGFSNNCNDKIEFTCEKEQEGSINFLYVSIIRCNNR